MLKVCYSDNVKVEMHIYFEGFMNIWSSSLPKYILENSCNLLVSLLVEFSNSSIIYQFSTVKQEIMISAFI